MGSTFWSVCVFILVTELCERFTYYSITGSLPLFLQTLCVDSVLAIQLTNLFSSLVYVTPVLGAYIADKYWGRYKTILFFCIWYMVGLLFATAGAWPTGPCDLNVTALLAVPPAPAPPLWPSAPPPPPIEPAWEMPRDMALIFTMVGLFGGIAVGAGGIKANVVVLGADQYELPAQVAEQDSFFRWFYWSINIGATIAFTFVATMAVQGLPPLLPQTYGFFASFVLPTVAFTLGVTAFFCGRGRYNTKPPQGSAVDDFVRTLYAAAVLPGRGRALLSGCALLCASFVVEVASFFFAAGSVVQRVSAIGGMAGIGLGMLLLGYAGSNTGWLHADAFTADPQLMRDCADVVRLLPLACCIVMFWCIYSQMSTTFQLQGCQMDLHVGGDASLKLSPANLNVFDSVVIMALIPLVDTLLYPALAWLGCPLSMLQKVGVGFCFAASSMFVAGYVEVLRKASPPIDGPPDAWQSTCPATQASGVHMNSLSIWWQVPQFLLIGCGEIFTAITSYELFYSQVPEHMRSVCQSINLLCTSFGSLAAAGVDSVLASWMPTNLNDGHLEYVFLVLGCMMVANVAVYVPLARGFVYSTPTHVLARASAKSSHLSELEPELRVSGAGDFIHSGAAVRASRSGSRSRAGTMSMLTDDGAERGTTQDALLGVPRTTD